MTFPHFGHTHTHTHMHRWQPPPVRSGERPALLCALWRFTRVPNIRRVAAKWKVALPAALMCTVSPSRLCQSCWFTCAFAPADHFWHGCRTNVSRLRFKHVSRPVSTSWWPWLESENGFFFSAESGGTRVLVQPAGLLVETPDRVEVFLAPLSSSPHSYLAILSRRC